MAVERQIEDREIVKMFSARNQRAISETAGKYGHMFRNIAKSILGNDQDAEECENDTYLRLWNAIPPAEPEDLGTYGAVTVRNLAFDLLARKNTLKRGGNMIFEELSDSIPDGGDHFTEEDELGDYIDAFLRKRKKKDRVAFILRYFYGESLSDISGKLSISESSLKSLLFRTRKALKAFLEKEGVSI